jgi:hypothetical protein
MALQRHPDVAAIETVDVRVYHRCGSFAAGVAHGPVSHFAAWWARSEGARWTVQVDGSGEHEAVRQAVLAELGPTAHVHLGDLIRAEQDEQGEDPA